MDPTRFKELADHFDIVYFNEAIWWVRHDLDKDPVNNTIVYSLSIFISVFGNRSNYLH